MSKGTFTYEEVACVMTLWKLLTGEVMIPRVMFTDRQSSVTEGPGFDSVGSLAQSTPNRFAYREEFGGKFTFDV